MLSEGYAGKGGRFEGKWVPCPLGLSWLVFHRSGPINGSINLHGSRGFHTHTQTRAWGGASSVISYG